MQAWMLAITTLAYILIGFGWPIYRVWHRTGVWPIVFDRQGDYGQRLFSAGSKLLFVLLIALSAANALLGESTLGLWRLPTALQAVGWLLVAGGFILTVIGHRRMGEHWRGGIDDRPTALVTEGIFRWTRNPVFGGLLLFMGGYLLLIPAWWSWALWPLFFIWLRRQVLREERHLIKQHGEAYRGYSCAVGRFLPWIGRLRFESDNHGRP